MPIKNLITAYNRWHASSMFYRRNSAKMWRYNELHKLILESNLPGTYQHGKLTLGDRVLDGMGGNGFGQALAAKFPPR